MEFYECLPSNLKGLVGKDTLSSANESAKQHDNQASEACADQAPDTASADEASQNNSEPLQQKKKAAAEKFDEKT